jgi:hypothetical protein
MLEHSIQLLLLIPYLKFWEVPLPPEIQQRQKKR